jgi:hypothetical protein
MKIWFCDQMVYDRPLSVSFCIQYTKVHVEELHFSKTFLVAGLCSCLKMTKPWSWQLTSIMFLGYEWVEFHCHRVTTQLQLINIIIIINPLPVQFKSLLHGQERLRFFQWAFKFTYVPVCLSTFSTAGDI